MLENLGFNSKHVAAWVKTSVKSRFYVQRKGAELILSCGCAIIRLPESHAWDLKKALPAPLPEGEGVWQFEPKKAPSLRDGLDLSRLMPATNGTLATAQDTALLFASKEMRYRLYSVPEGMAAVRDEWAAMFNAGTTSHGTTDKTPVAFCQGSTVIGILMPAIVSLPKFLKVA